jgi:DNA-binding XRE family transcriptional regulator
MNIASTLGGEAMIVLTRAEYDALVEDAGDNALADAANAESAGAPAMPDYLVVAVLSGAMHPLTAWRKAMGLTQAELAAKAQTRAATIADIEGGKIDPRYSTLKAIAGAIGVDAASIMP